jgi:predicted  nucleic acid-binding Zn-ribbon protein
MYSQEKSAMSKSASSLLQMDKKRSSKPSSNRNSGLDTFELAARRNYDGELKDDIRTVQDKVESLETAMGKLKSENRLLRGRVEEISLMMEEMKNTMKRV